MLLSTITFSQKKIVDNGDFYLSWATTLNGIHAVIYTYLSPDRTVILHSPI